MVLLVTAFKTLFGTVCLLKTARHQGMVVSGISSGSFPKLVSPKPLKRIIWYAMGHAMLSCYGPAMKIVRRNTLTLMIARNAGIMLMTKKRSISSF